MEVGEVYRVVRNSDTASEYWRVIEVSGQLALENIRDPGHIKPVEFLEDKFFVEKVEPECAESRNE